MSPVSPSTPGFMRRSPQPGRRQPRSHDSAFQLSAEPSVRTCSSMAARSPLGSSTCTVSASSGWSGPVPAAAKPAGQGWFNDLADHTRHQYPRVEASFLPLTTVDLEAATKGHSKRGRERPSVLERKQQPAQPHPTLLHRAHRRIEEGHHRGAPET